MPKTVQPEDPAWAELVERAWQARENAQILGRTKVGSCLAALGGGYHAGCNVEQVFRSHDIHAEVNAIGTMVAAGHSRFDRLLIVAERDLFTPCGACMDWIMQFGGPTCLVGFQNRPGGEVRVFTAAELMPFYPLAKATSADT